MVRRRSAIRRIDWRILCRAYRFGSGTRLRYSVSTCPNLSMRIMMRVMGGLGVQRGSRGNTWESGHRRCCSLLRMAPFQHSQHISQSSQSHPPAAPLLLRTFPMISTSRPRLFRRKCDCATHRITPSPVPIHILLEWRNVVGGKLAAMKHIPQEDELPLTEIMPARRGTP